MRLKYVSPCCLFVGVLVLGASVNIGYYVVPYKVREKVMENSKIVDGNTRFNSWEVVPVPLFQNIYLFNVTNPDEVIRGGKPVLQEIGPYVYQQKRRKFDIVFNGDNGTVFYRERTNYFFRPDVSNGSESDIVTFINLPFMIGASKAAKEDSVTRYVVQHTLNENYPDEKLYFSRTVGELLFSGIYIPFAKDFSELKGEEVLPNNTFGLFYNRNGSDQGRFEIFSGVKHPEKFGNIATWNGNSTLNWWGQDEYCSRINGSDGGVFPPFATTNSTFTMFIPGLCRSFRFKFESEEAVKGVPVIKFSIPPTFFASAKTNPDNACYCQDPGINYENCYEDGVFDLTGCGKVSMILSQPHFYQGSDLYVNQSVGLSPSKERHEMALFVEPYTSSAAKMNMRFQMNVHLEPNKFFRSLKKIPNMIHPLFWIDQTVVLPDESAATLRDKLHGTVNTANLFSRVGIIVGASLIILSFIIFFLLTTRKVPVHEKLHIAQISFKREKGTFSKGKVSFHGNGDIPNSKITRKKNEYVVNRPAERRAFLKQNGTVASQSLEHDYDQVAVDGTPREALYTEIIYDNPDGSGSSDQTLESAQNIIPIQPTTNSSSPPINLLSDPSKHPDSHLSPFPVGQEFWSSNSIADNETRNAAEASSSYENL